MAFLSFDHMVDRTALMCAHGRIGDYAVGRQLAGFLIDAIPAYAHQENQIERRAVAHGAVRICRIDLRLRTAKLQIFAASGLALFGPGEKNKMIAGSRLRRCRVVCLILRSRRECSTRATGRMPPQASRGVDTIAYRSKSQSCVIRVPPSRPSNVHGDDEVVEKFLPAVERRSSVRRECVLRTGRSSPRRAHAILRKSSTLA